MESFKLHQGQWKDMKTLVLTGCWISSLASIGNDSLSHLPLGWRPFRLVQDRPERSAQIKKRWTPRSTVFPRHMTLSLWFMTSVLISLILISNYIFHSPAFVGRNPAPVDMGFVHRRWRRIASTVGLLFHPPNNSHVDGFPFCFNAPQPKESNHFTVHGPIRKSTVKQQLCTCGSQLWDKPYIVINNCNSKLKKKVDEKKQNYQGTTFACMKLLAAMYYQNDGKKVMPHSTKCLDRSVKAAVSFFPPPDNPMDWIYEKTLEYPMLWIYTLCILYNIHLYIYSIAYLFSSLGTHWISTLHQGSILSTYKRKQLELVQSHFLDTQKIQIHKIWDTKTRCKPGTLSNHFKMDAWCNNHFSCEDSKSI